MEQKKEFLIHAAWLAVIAAGVWLVMRYLLGLVMPFVIGFLIASLLRPAVEYLVRRFGMKRRPCSVMLLLIFFAAIGMLLTVAAVRLTVWTGDFARELPALWSERVEPAVNRAAGWANGMIARLGAYTGGEYAAAASELFASMRKSAGGAVSELSVRALSKLSEFAAAIPGFLASLFFAVIAAFFFLIDYDAMAAFAKKRLPAPFTARIVQLKKHCGSTVMRYARSFALILLITFGELALGLTLLRAEKPLLRAAGIAAFDLLPVLGCGGILIPWGILSLLGGETRLGIGLLVLWAVIALVRSIIEPRIVGQQMGVHPLITLAAIFIGGKLFGFAGMLLLPIAAGVTASVLAAPQE